MEENRKFKVSFQIWCPYAKSEENVYLTGNLNSLGNWSPENSVKLYNNHKKPTIWKSKIFELKFEDCVFEYKYIIRNGDDTRWQGFKGNRIIKLRDVKVEGYDSNKQIVIFYDQEFSLPTEVNISIIPFVENWDNNLENESLADLRRYFDLSFSQLLELKTKLNEHKLPIEDLKNELCKKYDKVTEKVTLIFNDISNLGDLSTKRDIDNL
jgi:hypothetical protein